MSNMRVVANNVANSATSIVASTTAGTLSTDNLLTDIKTEVWRSTSTSATLTVTWGSAQMIGLVCLPFTNLTSTATLRVRGYTNASDSSAAIDTGANLCCPYVALGLFGWGTQPFGANSYSFGGGAYATSWFAITAVKKIVIDIFDSSNPSAYVEAGRLVCGNYWESVYAPDRSLALSVQDSTKNIRTDGGDLVSNIGYRNKLIPLSNPAIPATDRDSLYAVVRNNGVSIPLFVSIFPGNADTNKEQMFQVYGKLTSMQPITNPFSEYFSAQLTIEEV